MVRLITERDLAGQHPGSVFIRAFEAGGFGPSLTGCGAVVVDAEAVIAMSAAIQNGPTSHADQKFVVAIGFAGWGKIAFVDLFSTEAAGHKDMVRQYGGIMGWQQPEFEEGNLFAGTYSLPVLVAGGHLKVTGPEVSLFSSSGDFGEIALGVDVRQLGAVAARCSGLQAPQDTAEAERFLEDLAHLMLEHGGKPDFYERTFDWWLTRLERLKITGQNLGGLLTMKVLDRVLAEGGEYAATLVEELSGGGIGSYFFVKGVSEGLSRNAE